MDRFDVVGVLAQLQTDSVAGQRLAGGPAREAEPGADRTAVPVGRISCGSRWVEAGARNKNRHTRCVGDLTFYLASAAGAGVVFAVFTVGMLVPAYLRD